MPVGEPDRERRPAHPTRRAARALREANRLAEQGDTAAAVTHVQSAIDAGADRYTCCLLLARLYRLLGCSEDAVAAAEMARCEDPSAASAYEALIALHLEARNYPRAVEVVKALLRIDPRHVSARDALGAAYIGMGNVRAAMRVANDLVRLYPDDPGHRFKKALLCEHQGALRLAVEEFQRVLDMSTDSAMAVGAREQLELLDAHQLDQILSLAEADGAFRMKLLQSCDEAIDERGFCLSDAGRLTLQSWVAHGLDRSADDQPPRLYH
jgi:tetratricopeptide (TPR) repeat protein